MATYTHRSTRRIISLAVLGMLAIAVVAGQANANLPADATSAYVSSADAATLVIDLTQLRQADVQPKLLDTFLSKPSRAEKSLDRLAGSPDTRVTPAPNH